VSEYFRNEIYPGDIMYYNDSATGGAHLPDCALLRPIFWENELVAWSCNKAHMLDVGGSGNPMAAKDLYSEGLRITPVKIYEMGKERRDVLDLILANWRYPELERQPSQAPIPDLVQF
jgi:N-methylhydantoinase B